MIGILLKDNEFEQDIRELLMAFYPGERFAHQETEGVKFYVKGEQEQGVYRLEVDGETCRFEVPEGERLETKNRIKQNLYRLLEKQTGQSLPWGTLTGIRPTKIPLTKLEEGWEPEDIREFMRKTYYASEEKIALSVEVAERERELLSRISYEDGYSLYVGIPFCPTTCLYCSFTSYPIGKWEKRMEEYLGALFQELEYTAGRMKGKKLDTVYFGGGTPTSLSAEHLEQVIGKVEELFDLSGIQEFTVEAGRPDSITAEKLEVLKRHGITRISINPQTMNQKTLDIIGRRHTVEMVKEKFALAPDSITVHSLALKRAARLNLEWDQYAQLGMVNTQEMIDLTARYAREMGMEPYYLYRQKNMAGNFENVGYALPGKACIYNILIMEEMQTIAACGAGTTTKVVYPAEHRRERAENVKDVEQYIGRIDEMIGRKDAFLR